MGGPRQRSGDGAPTRIPRRRRSSDGAPTRVPRAGFWDPFNLIAEGDFWGLGNEATIGYLRHAEIKHGRVAMAAFLGFIVQSLPVVSGEHWFAPYRGYVAGVSPQEQWDNVPAIGKLQILVAIGMLESYGEGAGNPEGYVHYCNGPQSASTALRTSTHRHLAPTDATSPHRSAPHPFLRRRPPRLLPADRRPRRLRPGWLQPLRPVQLVRLRLPGQGQGTEPVCKYAIDATLFLWPRRLGGATLLP